MSTIYIIGSLRNPKVPEVANALRAMGYDVFDDWYAAGEKADDAWQAYEMQRGTPYDQALKGLAAKHVFNFDHTHLQRADIGVLVMPAGKSGHLEFGWMLGQEKQGYVLFDGEWPERWDQMYQFADGVFKAPEDLYAELKRGMYPQEAKDAFTVRAYTGNLKAATVCATVGHTWIADQCNTWCEVCGRERKANFRV